MADEPQNILLLADRFQVRGSSSYSLRLAAGLPSQGFSPLIVSPNTDCIPESVRGRLEIYEDDLLDVALLRNISRMFLLRRVRELKPRLVHVQSRFALSVGLPLAQKLGIPCLMTVHNYLEPQERLPAGTGRLARVIAVSRSVRDALIQKGMTESLIETIHSGVSIPDESDNSEILNGTRIPVVGSAGPLEVSKGLPFFLEAARLVIDSGHDVEFLIAGTGPEEHRLRSLVRQHKLTDHVTFVTNLQDFTASLRAMDLFCLPSLAQGLGTVMLEAMALARPVIATGVGGSGAVVKDGETGLIVPPSNPEKLAERIIELLSDPIRARSIGNTARKLVSQKFDTEQMVMRTAAVYREVISNCEQATSLPQESS